MDKKIEEQIRRLPQLSPQELEKRFSFHPATTEEKKQAHETIRNTCLRVAIDLNNQLPEGREKALAITHLEEVMFWSNAAIARKE